MNRETQVILDEASAALKDVQVWEAQSHPAISHLLRFFKYKHLYRDLKPVSKACAVLANYMASTIPHNPELAAGLRKLLEAKDCFVRAQLISKETL